MTLAAAIATASAATGLTLPGMMLLPGCRAGSVISPRPASGPLFIQRRSLAIFIRQVASVRNWPDSSTAVSCELREAKKSRLGRRSRLVCLESWAATATAKPAGALYSRSIDGGKSFGAVRLTLARYLSLALEFQLAADILSTAIAPSWDQIGKLGAIAVIRTGLNFFLAREMANEAAEAGAAHSGEAKAGS